MFRSNDNAFLRGYRAMYKALGFYRGYNFLLWFIFGGALLGFSLSRLSYLDIAGEFAKGAGPGEWYWYQKGVMRVGITIHLGAIIPCGMLSAFQFVPIIRHKALIIHRINGYIILVLLWIATVGALVITRRTYGGDISTQAGLYLLSIITLMSSSMAYYNIKRLQIDQHRDWMLRTMFYMSCIITVRIIILISTRVITRINSYYGLMDCNEISFIIGNPTRFANEYPGCIDDSQHGHVAVHASYGPNSKPEQIGAAFQLAFGMSVWIAMFLHVIGVEIYIRMTPAEAERLRGVAYEKQLKAGLTLAGSAGLTVDVWGDGVWSPQKSEDSEAQGSVTLTEIVSTRK